LAFGILAMKQFMEIIVVIFKIAGTVAVIMILGYAGFSPSVIVFIGFLIFLFMLMR